MYKNSTQNGLRPMDRKADTHLRALAHNGIHLNAALVIHNNAVGDGQTKAGAFAHIFCGKKWIEYFVDGFLGHARAVVGNGNYGIAIAMAHLYSNAAAFCGLGPKNPDRQSGCGARRSNFCPASRTVDHRFGMVW